MQTKQTINIILNIILLLAGIVVFIGLVYFSEISVDNLIEQLKKINTVYILAMVILLFIVLYISAIRWELLLSSVAETKSFTPGYFFYYICLGNLSATFFLNVFGDIGIKTLALKIEHNISLLNSSYSVIAGQLLNLMIFFVMAIPSFLYLTHLISVNHAIILNIVILVIACLFFYKLYNVLIKLMIVSFGVLISMINHIPLVKNYFNIAPLSSSLLLKETSDSGRKLFLQSCYIYFVLLIYHYLLACALNFDISAAVFALAYPVSYIISAIGITPGGLGITELGWFGVFKLLGVDSDQVIVYVIGQRIIGGISVIISYCIAMFYYNYNLYVQRQSVKETPCRSSVNNLSPKG